MALMSRKLVRCRGLSNRAFLERYAAAGRIGLAGGSHWVDRNIRRSTRRVRPDGRASLWSHALLFEGRRQDGRHWVFEADVDWAKNRFLNGVQENPAEKYFDEKNYPHLAVLDFHLGAAAVERLLAGALDLLARRIPYDYSGILGTWLALRRGRLQRGSRLRTGRGIFCSAFVSSLYLDAGIRLVEGVAGEHVTPEHIAQTGIPHTAYLLDQPTSRP